MKDLPNKTTKKQTDSPTCQNTHHRPQVPASFEELLGASPVSGPQSPV